MTADLALVDGLLQRVGLHRLQEPQPGADGAEQQGGDEGQDAEAGGALVSSHRTSLASRSGTVRRRGHDALDSLLAGPATRGA